MIKPESNAPSSMKPWVRTTDKQIEQLESTIARVESVLDATSTNIDYALNQGLSNTFEFTPLEDGSTETNAGAINFTGAITSDSNISLAGTLIVGDPSRQEYDPTTGDPIGSIPNLEVVSGQVEINPVTEIEYYTTGQLNTTDTTFNVNGYGSINGDGMQITLSNNGQVERNNIAIITASGNGTNETFQITNNASNIAVYTAGKYVNISGIDPVGYNGTNLLITSVNTGVSPMTFTVSGTETGTYVGGGYVTINQPNSIYEGRLSVQGPAPDYVGAMIEQDGVYIGNNGGDPAIAVTKLELAGLTAPSAFIDQAVINGTRLFISSTPPTAVNDGDIWIDKTGIFTGASGGGAFTGGTLTSDLVLAAGSGTVEPLTFQTNSATTTTTAGAMEWGSGNLQFTNATTTARGVLAPEHYYSIASDGATYTKDTSVSIFPALTNGIPLESGVRYEFEGVLMFYAFATFFSSGTTSCSVNMGFALPTTTYAQADISSTSGTSSTFGAATDTLIFNAVTTALTSNGIGVATATRSTAGTANIYAYVKVKGHLKTSATGNFRPTVNYTGAGLGGYGGNLMAGSWISIKKTPEVVGAWT